jgi:hypothetical protein
MMLELKVEMTSKTDDFSTWKASAEGFRHAGHGSNPEEAIGDFVIKNRRTMPFKVQIDKIEF